MKIDTLGHALKRPAMYGRSDDSVEMFFLHLLGDLCWIDDRESEWEKIVRDILGGGQYATGQLVHQYNMPNYMNEITSTYTQIGHMLGYFQPDRLLSDREWDTLLDSLTDNFFRRDWTESEIHREFGQPSHEIGAGDTTVACYAPEKPVDHWVFFDLSRKYPGNAEHDPDSATWEPDYFDDSILRDVRLERNRFRLLPFAEWCRSDHEGADAEEGT